MGSAINAGSHPLRLWMRRAAAHAAAAAPTAAAPLPPPPLPLLPDSPVSRAQCCPLCSLLPFLLLLGPSLWHGSETTLAPLNLATGTGRPLQGQHQQQPAAAACSDPQPLLCHLPALPLRHTLPCQVTRLICALPLTFFFVCLPCFSLPLQIDKSRIFFKALYPEGGASGAHKGRCSGRCWC